MQMLIELSLRDSLEDRYRVEARGARRISKHVSVLHIVRDTFPVRIVRQARVTD